MPPRSRIATTVTQNIFETQLRIFEEMVDRLAADER